MKPQDSDHDTAERRPPQGEVGEGRGVATRRRFGLKFFLTLVVAAVADGLQLLFPPFWLPIDAAAAVVFFLLWGPRWEIAVALVPELSPGLEAFPCWTALALYLGGRSGATKT